jgi:RasGEF N-terminal motif
MQGTPEKLIEQLIEGDEVGDTYLKDFLLTYRTFIKDTRAISERLLTWFNNGTAAEKVG